MTDVSRFLSRLRCVHPTITTLFLNGGCYELYRILREIWPEAEAWRDSDFHVQTKIGPNWYDIRGRYTGTSSELTPMDAKDHRKGRRWKHTTQLPRE